MFLYRVTLITIILATSRAIEPPQPVGDSKNQTDIKKPEVASAPDNKPAQHIPVEAPVKHKMVVVAESKECASEVHRFCSERLRSSNFMVLDCLQDSEKTNNQVSLECNHFIWQFKLNLTHDAGFDKASEGACQAELSRIEECKNLKRGEGTRIPCLIEHYEEIDTSTCQSYINKVATIIFSDYRFMKPFVTDCEEDINKFKCGRLEPDDIDNSPHSQGHVVNCLNKQDVGKKCKKALLKVAELQSDDYHLDRPLYYACKDDREFLCPDVTSGSGKVFKCLYKHIEDPKLSKECKVKLESRQQLIAEDVKTDKSFYEACKKDIKENKCAKKKDLLNDQGDLEEDLKRADILLCLENAENKGHKLEPQCMKEMFDMRSVLIQDYKISPELVSACQEEIVQHCEGAIDPDGESIHCLMEAARQAAEDTIHGKDVSFGDQCRAAVEDLLHIVKPADDIRLDPPLQRACGDVVTSACADYPKGHGDIVNCLLENLDHDDMTEECEEKLLEIQYFGVRDFQLDNHLFKQCRKDAKTLCSASFDDDFSTSPGKGPLIFTCLHRLAKSDDKSDKKPSRACMHEMRRVMRERGKRINLHPEVEANCIKDLGEHCSDNDDNIWEEENGEMECLQDVIEDLSPECKEAVSKFSEDEIEDIEMDRILMKHCTPMIKKYCQELLDSDVDPSQVLTCLIDHKNDREMDDKCAAGIEHHQIISTKMEFKFSKKFREACENSVKHYCNTKKSKYEVVSCLSEHVRNDTLKDAKQRVDKHCQKQLKVELLQRSESINLDPKLKKDCKEDIVKHCSGVTAGQAQVMECLKHHKHKLSNTCHKTVFKRQQEQAQFGDYAFLHICKKMIKTHCRLDLSESELLDCLREKKDEEDFDAPCRKIIIEREIEQSRDFRLDFPLHKACKRDIKKFCGKFLTGDWEKEGKELEGKVINCLKKHFHTKEKPLSQNCEIEVKARLKEAVLNINMNPVVMKSCQHDIQSFCHEEAGLLVNQMSIPDEDGRYDVHGEGLVIECLKKHFQQLTAQDCKKEIAYLISESRIDVHIDPILDRACQKDLLSLCTHIPKGQGRQMSCLLSNLEADPKSMSRDCLGMLQRRKELWESAAMIAPVENLSELYEEIRSSPQRNYFFAIFFTCIGIIFIIGLTFGRVTKRVRAEMKNR